jgi:hypothetical protein
MLKFLEEKCKPAHYYRRPSDMRACLGCDLRNCQKRFSIQSFRVHWKFPNMLVNKLFDLMHEMHPGVEGRNAFSRWFAQL